MVFDLAGVSFIIKDYSMSLLNQQFAGFGLSDRLCPMKRVLIGLLLATIASAILYRVTTGQNLRTPRLSPAAVKTTSTLVPDYDHIFLIVEENKAFNDVVGSKNAPYINQLIANGSLLANYHATAHPSLPNYLELTSGTNDGIRSDCSPPGKSCEASVRNIADEIEESGRSWKEYAESMPTLCGMVNAGEYATKHNPFVYYTDITNNPERCKIHVVPFALLQTDLSGSMASFAFITPNLCDDMHDCSVSVGDSWLSREVPEILKSAACTKQSCLVVITWDENDSGSTNVPAIFTGTGVRSGYVSENDYTHYSLLHTIESAWNLQPLTSNDGSAPIIQDVFSSQK